MEMCEGPGPPVEDTPSPFLQTGKGAENGEERLQLVEALRSGVAHRDIVAQPVSWDP